MADSPNSTFRSALPGRLRELATDAGQIQIAHPPPMRTGNVPASNSEIGPIPLRPAVRFAQNASRPLPTGVTSPIPVMTSRRL